MDGIKRFFLSKFPVGSFARNMIMLMTGSTTAQLLTILASPIITRLYLPESYGVLSLFMAILSVLSVISCWRYELAIVLPEKDEDAVNILALASIICLGMSLLSMILVIFLHDSIALLLKAPQLAPLLYFLPISLILTGLLQVLNYWNTRRQQFKPLAISQIAQQSVTISTQLGAGWILHPGASGLVGGSIIGQATAFGCIARLLSKEDRQNIRANIKVSLIRRSAVKYKDFPLYLIWAALINTISALLPVFTLSHYFSATVVGFYSLGQKVISGPLGIIGSSVSQVFYPRAEESRRNGSLNKIVIEIFAKLLSLALTPMLIIAISGPELIGIIFGKKWITAGVYLQILSPYILINFVASPISSVYTILNKQRDYLIFNVLYIVICLVSLIVSGIFNNPLLVISTFSLVASLMYLFFVIRIFILSDCSIGKIVNIIKKAVFLSLKFIIPLILIKIFIDSSVLLFVSVIISMIVFLINFLGMTMKEKA